MTLVVTLSVTCLVSFLAAASSAVAISDEKWESFKTLEKRNKEEAWEMLKLWFKNNGNIQHEKVPWEDFRIFKEKLMKDVMKNTVDPSIQDASEVLIEDAWESFETDVKAHMKQDTGDVIEEQPTEEIVWDKLKAFYDHVQEDGSSLESKQDDSLPGAEDPDKPVSPNKDPDEPASADSDQNGPVSKGNNQNEPVSPDSDQNDPVSHYENADPVASEEIGSQDARYPEPGQNDKHALNQQKYVPPAEAEQAEDVPVKNTYSQEEDYKSQVKTKI